ncbi:MAG TPA: sulfite exporter TauE/SafE family protein [Actinomycetota bacterium]|jgi:hypothetical protein
MEAWHYPILFVAAFLAGGVNSIAGGGSVISFPLMLWSGIPPVIANATNNMALFPGYLSSANGYRDEIRTADKVLLLFLGPAVAGGALGAILLLQTPSRAFETVAPFLVLFATLLVAAQRWLTGLKEKAVARGRTKGWWVGALVADFVLSIYGGYFGVGLGILLLGVLGLMGFTNLHQMNGVKAILSAAIVAVALVYFAANGAIRWPVGLVMAAGASFGGYASARVARRVREEVVRRAVVLIGLGMSASLLVRLYL